jgi:hypothetical protein
MNDLDVTLDHIRQAVEWAADDSIGRHCRDPALSDRCYDQLEWGCETSCCIWGAACLLAGKLHMSSGPSAEWKGQSSLHSRLDELMRDTHADPKHFMKQLGMKV